jgi:hypothetical protein
MKIDRSVRPHIGASALYRKGQGWETVAAYPAGYDRPWAKALPPPPARDATPNAEDASADE